MVEVTAGAESRDEEVVQITEQVLKFKAAALNGVRCTYFVELDKQAMSAVYALDADIQNLTVFSGDQLEFIEVACPIERILEIYSFTDATAHVFPEAVLEATQPEDRDALLMGVFQSRLDDAVVRFCIALESVKARNVFVDSLTVLAMCRREGIPVIYSKSIVEARPEPSADVATIQSAPIEDIQPEPSLKPVMDGREMTGEWENLENALGGSHTGPLSSDEKSEISETAEQRRAATRDLRLIEDYDDINAESTAEDENQSDIDGHKADTGSLFEEVQSAREHEHRVLERLATAEEMHKRIKEDLRSAHAVRHKAEASVRKLHLRKHMMLPRPGPLEWVDGFRFGAWCSCVVGLNLACIVKHDDMSPLLEKLMNHLFLIWYISELALKFAHHGRSLFFGPWLAVRWNWLDSAIVASGVIDQWLAPLFGFGGAKSSLSVLRLLRMFRILRALKMIKAFLVHDTDWILGNEKYDFFMATVIAVNAVIMSVQLDVQWDDWVWVDNGFLLIYVVDLLLRMKRWGLHFFSHAEDWKWNWLDSVIVTTGIMDLWLMPGIRIYQTQVLGQKLDPNSKGASRMHSIMSLVRLTRLMRVFRLVRVVRCIPPLYSLLIGVLEALKAMQWVVVLTLLTLYGGAIVFTNLIGKGIIYDGGVAPPEAKEVFGTMSQSLFSLFELMNGETEVIDGVHVNLVGKLVFAAFIIIANWAILAILTAVVSENLITTSNRLNAEEKQTQDAQNATKQEDSLLELFLAKDPNKNGYITRTEWQEMIDDSATRLEITEGTDLSNSDMLDLFDCLAVDGSGQSLTFNANTLEGKANVAYIHLVHSLRNHNSFADQKSVSHVMMRMQALQEQVQTHLKEQHKEMMNMSRRIETHVRGDGASL